MSYPRCHCARMTQSAFNLSGPFVRENLSVFLVHGSESQRGNSYFSLQESLADGGVKIHETGDVGELLVENLKDFGDVFIQAGDVLKGGRQDRTIGVDFIVPAKSGRLPVPSFCVESGRWHGRHRESVSLFSGSHFSLHAKAARLASKVKQDQGAVWDSVAESQDVLGAALGKSLHSAASPTSYQLSVEDADLEKRRSTFRRELEGIIEGKSDVVGYAFYVNGQPNTVDTYSSRELFQKLWPKLLDVAIMEAISAKSDASVPPDKGVVEAWLNQSTEAAAAESKTLLPRTRVDSGRYEGGIAFQTFDTAEPQRPLHVNVIAD